MRELDKVFDTKKFLLIIFFIVVAIVLIGTFYLSSRSQISALYDKNKWKLVKQAEFDFDSNTTPEQILLLQSAQSTDKDGVGESAYDVQLLVIKNNQVIYDYTKEGVKPSKIQGVNPTKFFVDDYLDVRNVTFDKIPEIIFHSGFSGASDYTTLEHILQYNKLKNSFTDIAREEFFNSGTHELRWLISGQHVLVLIASPYRDSSIPDSKPCHYCSSPFRYDVYQWNSSQNSFTLYRSMNSTKSYEGVNDALQSDWAKIQAEFLK